MTSFMLGCLATLLIGAGLYVLTHRNLFWPTSVYVLRSRRGRILYIGKSNNVPARLAQHARDWRKRSWWDQVDQASTLQVRFSTRITASIAEAAAILFLLPKHNIEWNWFRRRSRRR